MPPFVIDPALCSWIPYDSTSDFPIQNLPLGIIKRSKSHYHACSIIGNQVIDLHHLAEKNLISIPKELLHQKSLNAFLESGKDHARTLRRELVQIFRLEDPLSCKSKIQDVFIPVDRADLQLPIQIGDYTDFYSSKEHATNVGIMFRDPANALLPNWLHIPVGYHGRASSIVVSGTDIKRPAGQILPKEGEAPIYSKSKQLDFELEMAFIIGKSNPLGEPISVGSAVEHIHGCMLFNDWSARDIQKWEYVPLGPFLGKNFASTISPWIIDLDALEPFRVQGPLQEPQPLDYLHQEGLQNFDIHLEVILKTASNQSKIISKSNCKYLYWSMIQQLAHHTVNGCNMRVGDVCASGTISGPTPDSYGSMLELAWKGTKPINFDNGETRTFIQNGDTLGLVAYAQHAEYRIGFGPCLGKIVE